MLSHKYLFLSLMISNLFGQGIINGFGLGQLHRYSGPNRAGQGIHLLAASYKKDVSLSNPTTWAKLKFTNFSFSYGAMRNEITNSFNEFSGLSSINWIIPLKENSALGFSLEPYSYQDVNILDSSVAEIVAFSDTIRYQNSFKKSGGIASFNIGYGKSLSDKIDLGVRLKLLFGSSRQNEVLLMSGNAAWIKGSIIKASRLKYSGVLLYTYFSSFLNSRTRLMLSYSYPIDPLDGVYSENDLFDDRNGNGFHDSYGSDFPSPNQINEYNETRLSNIYKPSEFSFSIDRNILSNSNMIIELVRFKDNGKLSTLSNIGTTNKISSGNILTVGLVRFPNQMGKNWTGNFILRSGFKYSHQNIEPTKNIISEIGYSMGFGFKFGATSNQLDINYYVGSRSFKEKFDGENIHQIQAGISLSDIWFVKRRQKK